MVTINVLEDMAINYTQWQNKKIKALQLSTQHVAIQQLATN